MRTIIILACLLLMSTRAWSEPDFNKLADAIHIAENGHSLDKGEQYGIHSVHYGSEREARAICIRTCRYKWLEWQEKAIKQPFLEYLSTRYCPVNSKVWLHNVTYYYQR